MNIYLCVCVDIQMIIYFLIENFDVDHSPQCFENTLTHFNIIIKLSAWSRSQVDGQRIQIKKCLKKVPKGITLVRMQYLSFHSSFQKMENGEKTIKLDRQVDQKLELQQRRAWLSTASEKCDVFQQLRRIQFYRCHVSNAMAH